MIIPKLWLPARVALPERGDKFQQFASVQLLQRCCTTAAGSPIDRAISAGGARPSQRSNTDAATVVRQCPNPAHHVVDNDLVIDPVGYDAVGPGLR